MNKGFFSESQTQAPGYRRRVRGCGACGLYKHCLTPKMEATGEGEKGILVIAEAPGLKEDEQGVQLIGPAGQLLRRYLKELGVDLDRDCRKINAVNCRPEHNRTPTTLQIECCRSMVWKEIDSFKPTTIILLGGSALTSYLGHRWKKKLGGITKWRGWKIPDHVIGAWVFPTFHPSFIARKDTDEAASLVFDQDLEQAVSCVGLPLPAPFNVERKIVVLTRVPEIKRYLKKVFVSHQGKNIAFDYETTGLKPYKAGHRIVCCSICEEDGTSTAFPMSKDVRAYLRRILLSPHIGKIAANMKFEEVWSRICLKCGVKNWVWDTMQAAHVLDNRRGITGVKFQAFVQFGELDYSSHIAPYLQGIDPKNANSFNRVDDADQEELLRYNAMDALLEYRLSLVQRVEMGVIK